MSAALEWFARTYAGRVTAITVAGLAARLALLGYQPLWRDEAFTAIAAGKPVSQLLSTVGADSAPPLAYLIEHAVVSVWTSPAGLRLLPALAGGAAIPLGAALGKRISGDRAGLLSAGVCAASPALALSALDARMYAIATTLVMAATLAVWRAIERPSGARWLVYGALTALALYTDYFALLAIPAQLAAVVLVLRADRRRVVLMATAAAIACLLLVPWLIAAAAQLTHSGQGFWVQQIGISTVSGTVIQFFAGPPVDPWVPLKPLLQTLQGLAVAAGVVAVAALISARHRLSAGERRAAMFCTVCGAGAVLLLFPLSLWHPLVDGRYASVVWGPLFPVIGAGLAALRVHRPVVAALCVLPATSLALALAATHPPTRDVIGWLGNRVQVNDVVDAYPSQYLLFLYYAPPQLLRTTLVVQQDVPWFWGTAAYPPGAITAAIPQRVATNAGTVYYVRQPDEPGPTGLPGGYAATATRCWTGVCVVAYTR